MINLSLSFLFTPQFWGQVEFFSTTLKVLLSKAQGHVVLGRNSNIPLDWILDKFDPVRAIFKNVPKNSCKIAYLLHLYGLIDAWWEDNPSTRDYTHFSHVHMYSRIDQIFTCTALPPYATSTRILSVPWSDYSLVKLSLSDIWTKPHPFPWRLNASMLNDPVLYTEIETELRTFFQVNQSSITSPTINWAAHKAAIQGKLIQLAARTKCNR